MNRIYSKTAQFLSLGLLTCAICFASWPAKGEEQESDLQKQLAGLKTSLADSQKQVNDLKSRLDDQK